MCNTGRTPVKPSGRVRANRSICLLPKYGGRVRVVGRVALLVCVVGLTSTALGPAAIAQTTIPEPPVTEPPSSTTPPTSSTSTTTSTTVPGTTTSTTAPSQPPGPNQPADSVLVPTTAQRDAARAAFVGLTDSQRQLLRRLQSSRDDLATARLEVLALTARVDAAQAKWAAADAATRRADQEVAGATRALDHLHDEIGELASALYRHLSLSVLFDTVNTAEGSDLDRLNTYAKAPQEVLSELAAQATVNERHLAETRTQATVARADAESILALMQSALAKQRVALAAAEDASAAAFDAVAEALGSTVALLAQVADPHFGSDAITEALAVAQAGDDEPASVFGAFRTPVPGAPLGSPYGIRVDPLTGSVGYHPGIDLEAAAGVEVHAAASGAVVMAGDCGGYGNCVVIDHGHSLATVSAHLSRVVVAPGQPVSDGQVIGLVGSTGRSTGPHLHFEVRLHGAPIDPIATLTS